MSDKYQALWVSHSSIHDFLICPRAYYLNNMYKDPASGNKISLISPPLALGQVVHEVVESLSVLPTDKRFATPLRTKYEKAWQSVAGEKGGFTDEEHEKKYFTRGLDMLGRIQSHPGPLENLAVKIKMDLPHYWLSEEDSIILCGKIDWLEYLPDYDQVHIIDFKTGKSKESDTSLQLPIYLLLTSNCQARKVNAASYWYLETDNSPTEVELPDQDEAYERVLTIAKKIQLARKLEKLACPTDGCRACEPLEKIVAGEATYVGTNDFRQDVYMISVADTSTDTSVIL